MNQKGESRRPHCIGQKHLNMGTRDRARGGLGQARPQHPLVRPGTGGRLAWARLQHLLVDVTVKLGLGLIMQLHLLVYALAGAGCRLSLTQHQLAHTKVCSKDLLGEVS